MGDYETVELAHVQALARVYGQLEERVSALESRLGGPEPEPKPEPEPAATPRPPRKATAR